MTTNFHFTLKFSTINDQMKGMPYAEHDRCRAGQMRCKTGRLEKRPVAIEDRCRAGHMKNRKDAGKDRRSTGYAVQDG